MRPRLSWKGKYMKDQPEATSGVVEMSSETTQEGRPVERPGVDRLPQEILLQIFSYLVVSDLFPLKLAGSRYLTIVINSIPRPTFHNYITELRSANPGSHPLHIAAVRGHEALIIAIFKSNMLISDASSTQFPPTKSKLQWAAEIGHNATVKQLLLNGARLAHTDLDSRTALHFAAVNGHEETAKLLLESRTFLWSVKSGQIVRYTRLGFSGKPEISAVDRYKKTPLCCAAEKGHAGTVRLLLKRGAKVGPESRSRDRKTSLDLAAENGHVEVVKLLLRSQDKSDFWPWYFSGTNALYWAANNGQIATAKLLLDELATLSTSNSFPLQLSQGIDVQDAVKAAVENGHEAMVRLLLERKANTPPTALKKAAAKRHMEILKVLLEWGLHNGGYGGEEKVALLWAASNGEVEIVRLLWSGGTGKYRETVDKEKRTALHCAAFTGCNTIWNGSRPFTDPRGYHNGHKEVVEYLLLHEEVHIEAKDIYGMTALHYAADGDRELANVNGPIWSVCELIIKLLLGHGADRRIKDNSGRLAIHCAAANGNTTVFSLLLQQKSDIEAKDVHGRTPLHYAVSKPHPLREHPTKGSITMIEFLLDEGADIDAIDDDGRTPIQYAANDGQGSIFDLLVDRGAKWDIKDNFGVAAVKGLAQRNSPKIRKRIEQGGYGGHGGIF